RALVLRAALGRVEGPAVPGGPRRGRHALRVPVLRERLVRPRARPDSDRRRHARRLAGWRTRVGVPPRPPTSFETKSRSGSPTGWARSAEPARSGGYEYLTFDNSGQEHT